MLEICEKCSKIFTIILDIFAFQLRSLDFEFSEDLFFQIKRAQKEAMIFLQIQSIKFTKKTHTLIGPTEHIETVAICPPNIWPKCSLQL